MILLSFIHISTFTVNLCSVHEIICSKRPINNRRIKTHDGTSLYNQSLSTTVHNLKFDTCSHHTQCHLYLNCYLLQQLVQGYFTDLLLHTVCQMHIKIWRRKPWNILGKSTAGTRKWSANGDRKLGNVKSMKIYQCPYIFLTKNVKNA